MLLRILALLSLLLTPTLAQAPASSSYATGKQGAVATVHPIASQIALSVLQDGGNAIDAAVAAGLALGVVDGFNSGIGGGCFFLIRKANGELVALDGRETAPAAAHRDLFIRDGKAVPDLSRKGPLAVGVPGALAAYEWVRSRHGTRPLAELIALAAKVAREGFVLGEDYVRRLRSAEGKLREFPGAAAIFLSDAHALEVGDRLIQEDLAATYDGIAKEGITFFYEGPVAQKIDAWMKTHGGILTATDFAGYRPKLREPVRTTYRDHEIVGFPPPSSGGIHVAQMLNILENFPVADLSPADRHHLIAESMKLAFADRAHWLGDADFTHVPRGLIDKGFAASLATSLSLERTTVVEGHHQPPGVGTHGFGKHTTHFTVADAHGNWVACTQTVNTTYGSGIVVPGTGVVLNNEMDDFAAQPGAPNAYGLLGAEANAVAPGKRPLSSMSPTIVLQDGEPVFSVGAAGGPTIISQALLAIVRRLDLNLPLTECLSRPRIHHQWRPDQLRVEPDLDPAIQASLKAKGHTLSPTSSGLGVSQALARRTDGSLEAASDPRVKGSALAF